MLTDYIMWFKQRSPIIFSNNSNKYNPTSIIIGTENRQSLQSTSMLQVSKKTGYRLISTATTYVTGSLFTYLRHLCH